MTYFRPRGYYRFSGMVERFAEHCLACPDQTHLLVCGSEDSAKQATEIIMKKCGRIPEKATIKHD